HVGAAERVELLHREHPVVEQPEQRHLLPADERRRAALGREVVEPAHVDPREPALGHELLRRLGSSHERTSRVVPATSTAPLRPSSYPFFSSAVAGRAWPRSATYASDGSGVAGALTND